jgi:RNA polymerase sigma factor (sigma-70 family)
MQRGGGMKAGSPRAHGELSSRQLEAAELGFKQLLRRKRFSAGFRERHTADLLAQARLEYARHVAAGEEIENPVGWIINCAWRRTQNVLKHESHAPRRVSGEAGPEFAVETRTPEEEVLAADRRRQLQAAIEELSREELRLIALTYFEGMSVREASEALGWDKCKGDRRHHAALKRLKQQLGVENIDALGIEIGIAAWAAAAAGSGAGPIGSAADALPRIATELLARAQELARRALTGGAAEPGIGSTAGIAARTAGVCGAAAVACLASGVIGPGLGGVGVGGHRPARGPAAQHRHAPQASRGAASAAVEAPPAPQSTASTDTHESKKRSVKHTKPAAAKASRRQTVSASASSSSAASGQQVEEEFTPFASESPSTESSQQGSGASTPSSSSGSGGGGSASAAASGQQVEAEFGL